jgi:hypothetical protein
VGRVGVVATVLEGPEMALNIELELEASLDGLVFEVLGTTLVESATAWRVLCPLEGLAGVKRKSESCFNHGDGGLLDGTTGMDGDLPTENTGGSVSSSSCSESISESTTKVTGGDL